MRRIRTRSRMRNTLPLNAWEFKTRWHFGWCDLATAMKDDDEIYEFLTFHRYPAGFSKNQKRVLRRKSQEHFRVKRGLLFYSGLPRSQADDAKRQGKRVDREWRQVPQTEEKRERIIQSCHSSLEGTNNS